MNKGHLEMSSALSRLSRLRKISEPLEPTQNLDSASRVGSESVHSRLESARSQVDSEPARVGSESARVGTIQRSISSESIKFYKAEIHFSFSSLKDCNSISI